MANTNSTGKFVIGLVFGGLAGLAAAMLYAPQSGDETRRMIRNTALDARVRTQDGLRQAQEQVGVRFENVHNRVSELAQNSAQTARTATERIKDSGNEAVQGAKSDLEASF